MKILLLMFLFVSDASAETHRSKTVLRKFQKLHPCPSTGLTTGKCPGYVKDHIKALACHGADSIENLQWQTIKDGKAKDKWERIGC